jgi:hypothetical protein
MARKSASSQKETVAKKTTARRKPVRAKRSLLAKLKFW